MDSRLSLALLGVLIGTIGLCHSARAGDCVDRFYTANNGRPMARGANNANRWGVYPACTLGMMLSASEYQALGSGNSPASLVALERLVATFDPEVFATIVSATLLGFAIGIGGGWTLRALRR